MGRFLETPIKKPLKWRADPIPLCREYARSVPWDLSSDSGVTLLPAPSVRMDGSYVCVPSTVMFPLGPNLVALYLGRLSWACADKSWKTAPFRVIYHRVVRMSGEIERDSGVSRVCAGATAVKRSSSIKDARVNCANQEPSQKELTSFISNHIPEN